MAVEIIRCPACGEQARITYEENRVYQMSCVHCHNAMFHQDTSFDNAVDFFKRVVILPCKVGDTVYANAYCADVIMNYDNDYETGTGARDCPFEYDCNFEECDDDNRRVFETTCTGFFIDGTHQDLFVDHINAEFYISDIGKTVFLTRAEAEAKGGAT